MRRDLLLMLMLATGLATGVGQTDRPDKKLDKKPGAESAVPAAKTQKKDSVSRQKKETQLKTKASQEATAEAQPKTPEQNEAAQVKTEAEQKEAQAQTDTDKDPKLTSVPGGQALGMSILGNQEAPTSLVIVPWKSSEVGRATGISPMLDDSRQPVDKEVFMRELRYYEIRSEKKP
jgi:hypothetical protein